MGGSISKTDKLLQNLLSEQRFGSENLGFVTNRQVHYWKEIGLIDDCRKYTASGMKSRFSFYEGLWIRIIIEMRSFRIGNHSIRKMKEKLFQNHKMFDTATGLNLFINTVLSILISKEVCFLLVLRDESIKVLDKKAYVKKIESGKIDHHFSLQFNVLIREMIELLEFTKLIQEIIQETNDTKNE